MTSHELNQAFDAHDLPFCKTLREMLDEHPSHRTVRRGCGLTQATRFLSVYVNAPRDPGNCIELGMFADRKLTKPVSDFAQFAIAEGWPHGWRQLSSAPQAVREALSEQPALGILPELQSTLRSIRGRLKLPESLIVLDMMAQLLGADEDPHAGLPGMRHKPEIGSCSQAEEFFLEMAHRKIRRGGTVNVFTDEAGKAVLFEKVNLGESHSAMVVRPCVLNGVRLVPGSLVALSYPDDDAAWPRQEHGWVIPLSTLTGVYYMRLTTLGVPPSERKRAFSIQFKRQMQEDMLSPHSTTINDLVATADKLAAIAK